SLNSLSSDDAEDKVIVFERNATVPLLPWPDHWGHSTLNKKFLIATLICAVFLVISPFYTWSALGQGDLFKAAYGVMMVAAAAVFTAIAASSIRPRRASATLILVAEGGDSADGLRINASRGRAYMLWAFLSIGVAFFVVRGVMVLNLALG